jgi:hypothetical protein
MGRLRVWLLVFIADPYSNKINYSEGMFTLWEIVGQNQQPPTCAMSDKQIYVGISMRLQLEWREENEKMATLIRGSLAMYY